MKKNLFCCLCALLMYLSVSTPDVLNAQSFVAVDDEVITGPRQRAFVNVMINDYVPCATDTVEILTVLNPSVGTARSFAGGFIEFIPGAASRDTSVNIVYGVRCGSTMVTATLRVHVAWQNNPANILNDDVVCYEEMPTGVAFAPALKYVGASSDLDGFSMPLVGDINGDGKPEIVALGLSSGGTASPETDILNGLVANAGYVVIYNGQTGVELAKWTLPSTFKLRYEPRHNSVSKLAMADVDNDGLAEIIVTYTNGYIYCLKPVYNSNGEPSTYAVMWSKTTATDGFKHPVAGSGSLHFGSPTPYIADINGDGTPELIVYNKIYNAKTGSLDCTLETLNEFAYALNSDINVNNKTNIHGNYAFVGRRPGAKWNEDDIACMAIVDINGDGFMDIVAGSKVYLMKDDNGKPALDRIIYGPQSITAQRGTESVLHTVMVNDGFTAVADVDGNDTLDVIVMAPAEISAGEDTEMVLYLWEPMKSLVNDINTPAAAKAATYLYVHTATSIISTPFIGDINGRKDDFTGKKRLPEICFTAGVLHTKSIFSSKIASHPLSTEFTHDAQGFINNSGFNGAPVTARHGHIIAFTYHADASTPLHERLKLSWAMEHLDNSGCTGITMFDFDNDGVKELCYRDEVNLRVISPAGLDPVTNAQKHYLSNSYVANSSNIGGPIIRFRQRGVRSYTAYEAPVIADVNMDGSADILTLAVDKILNVKDTTRVCHSRGYLYVFEHAPGTPKWAPSPSIWNQAYYSPLMINEDMTVPAKPQSMLRKYYSAFVGDSIQPYNGHWIQQSLVKDGLDFRTIIRKPDAIISDMKVEVHQNNTTDVVLTIVNKGEASVSANAHITFYDGGMSGTGLPIGGGAVLIDSKLVGVDIFPNKKERIRYTLAGAYTGRLIWARVMDHNGDFVETGEMECDSTNNVRGAADCPTFKYSVESARKKICGTGDSVKLTAVRDAQTAFNSPSFQWHRNEIAIPGATDSIYYAKLVGEYKCFVIDGICRGFSVADTLTLYNPSAIDYYIAIHPKSKVTVGVLSHESVALSCAPQLSITVPPTRGAANINSTGESVVYTPANSFLTGIDSLSWSVTANGYTEEAKLYIAVINAGSDEYIACPGAAVKLEMTPVADVSFYWYDSELAANPVAGGMNTSSLTVIKQGTNPEEWWVEARWKGKSFSRFLLELISSDDCGGSVIPSGCAGDGSVVEIEDFGGNSLMDSRVSSRPLAGGVTSLVFVDNEANLSPGKYCLLKYGKALASTWHQDFGDHTVSGDRDRGYMFMTDAAGSPAVLYQKQLKGLCRSGRMYLSLWASNLMKSGYAGTVQPVIKIELLDGDNYPRLTFVTSAITEKSVQEWVHYGFPFDVPDDCDSLGLRIWSMTASTNGNDLAIDDIELRLCTPPLQTTINGKDRDTLCYGQQIRLVASEYADNGSLVVSAADVMTGYWTESSSGDVNRPGDWSKITGSEVSSTPGGYVLSSSTFDLTPSVHDTVYYRFVIVSSSVTNPGCRVGSAVLPAVIKSAEPKCPDIRIQMCALPQRSIYLSSYLDTIYTRKVLWSRLSKSSPNFIGSSANSDGELHTGDFSLGTHVYQYEVENECSANPVYGMVYLKNTNRPVVSPSMRDTVVVCHAISSSNRLQLNQILGLETFGTWDYPVELTPFVSEVSKPSKFAGAYIFDARGAWNALKTNPLFRITYNGDTESSAFVFTYTSNAQSCIGVAKRELVLVVTGKLLPLH